MKAKPMTIGLVLVVAGSTATLAGEKAQSNFTQPASLTGAPLPVMFSPPSAAWTQGVSKGKTKGDDKCKTKMKLSGLTLPDTDQIPGTGDEIICISHANVSVGGAPIGTTTVFRAEVKSGKAKLKVDLFAEGVGCIPTKTGGLAVEQYESNTVCYEPDPGYPAPPLPFISDPTQGVFPAGFGPNPASPMIATDGISFLP